MQTTPKVLAPSQVVRAVMLTEREDHAPPPQHLALSP